MRGKSLFHVLEELEDSVAQVNLRIKVLENNGINNQEKRDNFISQIVSSVPEDLVEEAPVVPEEAPVVPEEAPVVPEEAPVVPEEAPVVPEEEPVVSNEGDVVSSTSTKRKSKK